MLISRPLPNVPERIMILGAGRFGSAAAYGVSRKWPDCEIHIADLKTSIDSGIPGSHHPSTEAMDLMLESISREEPDTLVVPCVPVHVAFNWVLSHLGFCIPVPVRLMETLPGAIGGKDGCIYCSYSDFKCPENCPEPAGHCPESGKERLYPLYDIIASVRVPSYTVLTVRSMQLLPGTGAMTAGALLELLDLARKRRGRFLIATASRCHGVVHGFTH